MRIVIALGGNALGNTPDKQKENTDLLAKKVINLIKDGHEVIFTHGNGPQVGLINLSFETANKINPNISNMPFSECSAMSQGYIGYHLINSITNELVKNNINKSCVNVLTRVLVDEYDNAFNNPTKPIGNFYKYEEIKDLPYIFKEDSGRGYRRVIASPKPIKVIENDAIINLLEKGFIVIGCGGGGIPVIFKNNKYIGIDAVIDKDLSSAVLAKNINADVLLILTAVSNVKINFNKENETNLFKISLDEIKKYYKENHFLEGSMKPKIDSCIIFLENSTNKKAIITDIESAFDAINNKKGTIIY